MILYSEIPFIGFIVYKVQTKFAHYSLSAMAFAHCYEFAIHYLNCSKTNRLGGHEIVIHYLMLGLYENLRTHLILKNRSAGI